MKIFFAAISFVLLSQTSFAQLPQQPADPQHPSSAAYTFTSKMETLRINGRAVEVFLPVEAEARGVRVPVVVFGHGQAIGVEGYDLTFKHLAQKGIAVIHPQYDNGFFDQDWARMASDFNSLTAATIQRFASVIDSSRIVYSGHSKGAYVALMAAGAPANQRSGIQPKSMVLFAPAGYDGEYLKRLDVETPVTLIYSDADTVIKLDVVTSIFARLPSRFKQWIMTKSYQGLKADHFFPLNKSYFFGGRDGVSAYHYFATWKWLVAAAQDLGGSRLSNPYLYGPEASSTGVDGLKHEVTR